MQCDNAIDVVIWALGIHKYSWYDTDVRYIYSLHAVVDNDNMEYLYT